MKQHDLIIIGGGPAGLAAAYGAWNAGLRDILILERDRELGGVLNQCIHNGFGQKTFGEMLTGPEYADRYLQLLEQTGVQAQCDTMVLRIEADRTVVAVSPKEGVQRFSAKAIVLAMGCRERTRGAIAIPGDRTAGIFTAGAAQRYMNIEGYMVGKRAVILGSGDVGLIAARRLSLEGAEVLACVEIMPYSSGLRANIVRCLEEFDIPLMLSHTITNIRSENGRVCGVTVQKVDERLQPIAGTEQEFCCDTVLLSVGLLPENELTRAAGIRLDARTRGAEVFENRETSMSGVFACGNVLHVHDLVDYVSSESEQAGAAAAKFVLQGEMSPAGYILRSGDGVSYTVPQRLHLACAGEPVDVYLRVKRALPRANLVVRRGEQEIARFPRQFVAPGEMQRITLSCPELAGGADGEELTVSLEEALDVR